MQSGGRPRPDQQLGPVRRTTVRLLVRGVDAAMRSVTRLLGASLTEGRERISEAELRDLIAANTSLDREERRLIAEVLATGTRSVREVMVPRTDVRFLDAGLQVSDALREVRDARHSRFPVTDGGADDVIGFVHLRDLTIRPDGEPGMALRGLVRDVKRLPGSKRVLAALSEMRREGHHLALVVDEYGGTAGIVTLEDLIEELVGEIHDEYDVAPEPALARGVRPSVVDGRLNLSDFEELSGLALPSGPYETVGGFLMARLGKVPHVGDEVRVDALRMVVSTLDGRRVARVTLLPAGGPAPAPAPEPELVTRRTRQRAAAPLAPEKPAAAPIAPEKPAAAPIAPEKPAAAPLAPEKPAAASLAPEIPAAALPALELPVTASLAAAVTGASPEVSTAGAGRGDGQLVDRAR